MLLVEPIEAEESKGEEGESNLLQLQLTMATSSINHEYARLEFEDTADVERKEALLDYMNECRTKYFEARESLVTFDPNAAADFERDLLQQKQKSLNNFNA